jgi:tetratricopeptide (TPR) repeat protein
MNCNLTSSSYRGGMPLLFILSIFTILLFFSCTFPRVIVLEDPLSPEEHINLGVAYEKKGDLYNAIKEYNLASKKLPLAYLYLGTAYFKKSEVDKAEKYLKKAIRKTPDNADSYNNLAWLYYVKKKNIVEAESLVLKAIELNPSKKDIYNDTLKKIRKLKKSAM